MNIVVVLHVCRSDHNLAVKWLKWARVLADTGSPYRLVVFVAKSVETALVQQLAKIIDGWGAARIEIVPELYEHPELGYASMANFAFRSALEMTERLFPGVPTLWVESDAIPTNPFWVYDIVNEYERSGMPVLGDFHPLGAIPHVTGNAVYPANWRELLPSFADLPNPRPEQGWDTLCSHETVPLSARSGRIQQVWITPKFTDQTVKMVHPWTSLFHRCKDGSLIDVLAKRMGYSPIPLDRPVCGPAPVAPRSIKAPAGGMEILIVSFRRDHEMVDYCLKSIRKYCRGFSGVTLAVPSDDARFFQKFVRDDVKLTTFVEPASKGFLIHEIMKCRADELCPDAQYILHIDSDLLFWRETTPGDFLVGTKCRILREHYDLIAPRNPNRLIWRDCVEKATGIRPTHDLMVAHPNVYPAALYGQLRGTVEHHTGVGFDEYVLSCENGWPQGFCEFVSLGAVGLRDMPEMFHPTDYDHERDSVECGLIGRGHQYIYRPDRDPLVEGWTHGGLSRYKKDWDNFLRGELPRFYAK